MNDKGEMVAVPDIAESWDTTDSQTWTFHLKKGVTFQPPVSREVTAQDFVDSWNYVTDPANQSYVSYILAPVEGCDDGGYQVDTKKGVTGVKALDDYTLQVTLRYPFAEFPDARPHRRRGLRRSTTSRRSAPRRSRQKPVGTGPYMVETWKNNQYVDLVKNPSYWDTANAGYVDTIHMPIIPEASDRVARSSRRAPLDYTVVPPGQVAVAEANPNVKSGKWTAKAYPNLGVYFVGINMTDKLLGQNLELRKAVMESADAQNVINIVNEGVADPRDRLRARGHPRLPREPEPVPVRPGRRQGHRRRPRHAADARVLVQHRRGPSEDRRGPAGRLAEGRHQTSS